MFCAAAAGATAAGIAGPATASATSRASATAASAFVPAWFQKKQAEGGQPPEGGTTEGAPAGGRRHREAVENFLKTMAFAFFKVPCAGGDDAAALNRFLRAEHALRVTKQFVDAGVESFWAFTVEYDDKRTGSRPTTK